MAGSALLNAYAMHEFFNGTVTLDDWIFLFIACALLGLFCWLSLLANREWLQGGANKPLRHVGREVWGPLRARYFAAKRDGTRSPEGL